MTNNQIIMDAAVRAELITAEQAAEFIKTGRMPELHTYGYWKKAGRQVKKGEKAALRVFLWKYVSKVIGHYTAEDLAGKTQIKGFEINVGDDKVKTSEFQKESYLFWLNQTEPISKPNSKEA